MTELQALAAFHKAKEILDKALRNYNMVYLDYFKFFPETEYTMVQTDFKIQQVKDL